MSNARIESVTLEGDDTVTTVTLIGLSVDEEANCERLLTLIYELARKQAHIRLAQCRMRRHAAEREVQACLREEIGLMRALDALQPPDDNYNQNIFDSFPPRS